MAGSQPERLRSSICLRINYSDAPGNPDMRPEAGNLVLSPGICTSWLFSRSQSAKLSFEDLQERKV
ncbi:hypothetical protein N7488_007820 [Penicillium malachiteum]|nr:hypothetical protein N7488_007820 [Penicillium malachiteum]